MRMNPFAEKPINLFDSFENWSCIYPKPYNKYEVDPYTKTRIILMNGTEFEANWFSHQFTRHCCNNDLRRELALVRRIEKQQQMKIAALKPCNESMLEHTIGYEQLAVDLTATLAQREKNCYVKKALDFALLEDFDHLYRYANLLEMEAGIFAEKLVGRYTEIMPGRPTIAHQRYPFDNVRDYTDFSSADLSTKLATMIITAAEQQTMNYYMNIVNFYPSDLGRRLYQEIGLVEEEHVTHYECLQDPNTTWLESLLMHEYTECYLYYSCYCSETDAYIKCLWEEQFVYEIAHLHKAAELLKTYENKDWQEVISCGEFPELLVLGPNIEYVRNIQRNTVQMTSLREDYVNLCQLPQNADFYRFQQRLNKNVPMVPSHATIERKICKNAIDYRWEVAPNPIADLRNRRCDNVCVGRMPLDIETPGFEC